MKVSNLLFAGILLIAMACNSDDEGTTIEERQSQLLLLNDQIQDLIADKRCNGIGDCASIAFGSKACGGPKEYLVYAPSTVDESILKEMVDRYNALEKELNELTGAVSTCEVIGPPELFCDDNVCIGR
ncbi:MAG: hypothetical protein AAFN93_09490 [Bacteroidota bacterium]